MLYVYHHIYSNDRGLKIGEEQKNRIYEKINLEFKYIQNIVPLYENEWPTLLKMFEENKNYNNEDIILYIHTKSAVNNYLYNEEWRELLELELVDNSQFYIDKIKMGFSTSGCLMGIPYWSPKIYGGNFWYINSQYLKTLKKNNYWDYNNRHSAENHFIQSGEDWKPYNNPLIDFNNFFNFKKFIYEEMRNIFKIQTNKLI